MNIEFAKLIQIAKLTSLYGRHTDGIKLSIKHGNLEVRTTDLISGCYARTPLCGDDIPEGPYEVDISTQDWFALSRLRIDRKDADTKVELAFDEYHIDVIAPSIKLRLAKAGSLTGWTADNLDSKFHRAAPYLDHRDQALNTILLSDIITALKPVTKNVTVLSQVAGPTIIRAGGPGEPDPYVVFSLMPLSLE